MKSIIERLLCPRSVELWHPESPGMRVTVTRTWIGRAFKDSDFATVFEALKADISKLRATRIAESEGEEHY